MNHDAPRQIADSQGNPTGKWRYTRRNDNQIWAIGFCADDCPGHDTPEEACEHHKEYLLSGMKIRGPKTSEWPKYKCRKKGCNSEATHFLIIPGRFSDICVCEAHANVDTARELVVVSEEWVS